MRILLFSFASNIKFNGCNGSFYCQRKALNALKFSLFRDVRCQIYSVFSVSSDVFLTLSPIQELEPGATPCRGGRCAAAILADRSSRLKNTKYFK